MRSILSAVTFLASYGFLSLTLPSFIKFVDATAPACVLSAPSCQNTTVVTDLCCFNAPGGQLVLTQFWTTDPASGPVDSWTMHGLWPDLCDGKFEQNCDPKRAYTGITDTLKDAGEIDLLDYMQKYWVDYRGKNEQFWQHEWSKHGTCISTLKPNCYSNYTAKEELIDYLKTAIDLFKTRDTYKFLANANILPSSSKTYTAYEIRNALTAGHGAPVTIQCQGNSLNEVWYSYNVRGSVQSGQWIPVTPAGVKGDCKDKISYRPKGPASPSKTVTKTATAPPPASTETGIVSGKGYWKGSGSLSTCLISGGTWYAADGIGCATFTATASGTGFLLKTSKGPCAVVSGALTCSSSTAAGIFNAIDGKLVSSGSSTTWYAAGLPSGSTQQKVFTDNESGGTTVTFTWKAV